MAGKVVHLQGEEGGGGREEGLPRSKEGHASSYIALDWSPDQCHLNSEETHKLKGTLKL